MGNSRRESPRLKNSSLGPAGTQTAGPGAGARELAAEAEKAHRQDVLGERGISEPQGFCRRSTLLTALGIRGEQFSASTDRKDSSPARASHMASCGNVK